MGRFPFNRVSCILDHHVRPRRTPTTTTTPNHRFVGMLAFITQRASPSNWNILRCRRLNPTGGSMDLPPVFFDLFSTFLSPGHLNGAASVLGLVSVFTAISLYLSPSSCIFLIVFISLLCHQSAIITMCMQKSLHSPPLPTRCLHHHSISRQPKPAISSTRLVSNIPTPLNPLRPALFFSTASPSLTHPGHLDFPRRCYTTRSSSELRNPSDCRRDQ
jgi:hypothetical protein